MLFSLSASLASEDYSNFDALYTATKIPVGKVSKDRAGLRQ